MDAITLKRATGCSVSNSQKFADSLSAGMALYDISTPLRICHFLAQVGHESMGFVYTAEIWGPTAAQKGYEGRKDLGNVVPGDGERFKGRGLIEITGRANYQKFSEACGIDVVTNPELVEQPYLAVLSACEFWLENNINALADADDILAVTKKVNGGTNGLDDRKIRLALAKGVLL